MHEGSGHHPLLFNPLLSRVVILLAKGAFRDYQTIDELLDVVPPGEGIVRIHWYSDFVDRPVYERGDGHIWSACAYCARPAMLAFELVFRRSATTTSALRVFVPSVRAFELSIPDSSSLIFMQTRSTPLLSAGDTLDTAVTPSTTSSMLRRTPGTDGQATYADDAPRTLPSQLLRLLKMNHNPELVQTLPARELHELVTGEEYSTVFAELENLPDSDSATVKKERAEILGRLRSLKLAALKQPNGMGSILKSSRLGGGSLGKVEGPRFHRVVRVV